MSRDLLSYLNDLPCGNPTGGGGEYAYLGHFADYEYLECGHNELGMEQQIDAGNIPDLQSSGKNIPAESEPGNISGNALSAGESEGKASSAPAMGNPKGGGSPILGSLVKPAVGKAVSSVFG